MAEYGTFSEVRARLDEIVTEVRKKDVSLERSLDLYEEAIKLGNRCAELVDKPDFSPEELAAADALEEASIHSVGLDGSLEMAPAKETASANKADDDHVPADGGSDSPGAPSATE